jgi:archaellum component FlaC
LGKEESAGATGETEAGSETSETNTAETEANKQSTPEDTSTPETAEQPSEGKKEDVEKLRTVIKVNEEESLPPTEEKKEEAKKPTVPKAPQTPAAPAGGSREDLEQRRNMLQSIKDFDFQIKKNQEDIGKMVEKLDGLTKDLDDLVSLYEIVSEQMNPFVGLSKVTKKRIDALENFTQEIDDIKIRMGDVESVVEKGVGGIKRLTKKLDDKSEPELEKTDDVSSETVSGQEIQLEETEVSTEEAADETQFMNGELSDGDLDILLSKSLENLLAEQNIDYMINEFLLSLK